MVEKGNRKSKLTFYPSRCINNKGQLCFNRLFAALEHAVLPLIVIIQCIYIIQIPSKF